MGQMHKWTLKYLTFLLNQLIALFTSITSSKDSPHITLISTPPSPNTFLQTAKA